MGDKFERVRCHTGVQLKSSVATGIQVKRALNDRGNCKEIEFYPIDNPKGYRVTLADGRHKFVPFSNVFESDFIEEEVKEKKEKAK